MKKNVNVKKFIIIQVILMILIAIIYLIFIPKLKPMCYPSNYCATAYNCKCDGSTCLCNYKDENGDIKEVTCQSDINQEQN